MANAASREKQPDLGRRALVVKALAFGSGALALAAGLGAPPHATRAKTQTELDPQARRGGTLRIGKPDDIVVAALPHVLLQANIPLYDLVYDTLIKYDEKGNPQARLATSWTWSPDFLELTVQLRPGVLLHTGQPFTSEHARFNLERLREASVGSQLRNTALLMQVAAPSADTLVIRTDQPARSIIDVLALTYMADPATLNPTAAGRQFVGTGPFRFEEWVPGDHLTAVANPNYWQPGKPYLDSVELRILPDPLTAMNALEAGAADGVLGATGQDAQRVLGDAAYKVALPGNSGLFYYLGLDVNTPSLADRRVREAFAYALNRQRLVDIAVNGFGRPASIPWPEQSLAYDASMDQTYTFDPPRARQLLEEVGWDPGTVVQLTVPNEIGVAVLMAEIVQADLASAGIQLAVQRLGLADFVARLQRAQMGGAWIASVGFMNFSPATFFMSAFPVRVPNPSNFVSQRYQDLITMTIGATDDQQLKQDLQALTQVMLEEAFFIPIAEGAGLYGPVITRANVRNLTSNRLGGFAYEDAWLE